MKLTRDEARILADALNDYKYEALNAFDDQLRKPLYSAFANLQERLGKAGQDQRRTGRTSQDEYKDMIKRFVTKHQKEVNHE